MDLFDQKKENKSLTSMIFEKLREDILNGDYHRGDKLVEAKIAEEIGVSRTPVREALKQLELDGLVDNIPNRGVVVTGISEQDIRDIYRIRMAIETISVEWCIERMDDQDLAELQEIFDLMEFFTAKGDVDRIFELNTRFHETIYRATESRYMEHVLKDFQLFIKSTRERSLRMTGRLETALEEHRNLLEAIKKRDVTAAKEAAKAHVMHSMQSIDR
jgi:DNA-binding GntR family transcriptional regulator